MRAYYDDFDRRDPAAAAAYCRTPCLWLADQGPFITDTWDQIVDQYTALLDRFRAAGYTGGGYTSLHVRTLGERTALTSAVAVGYGEEGRELERIGATYTLHRATTVRRSS